MNSNDVLRLALILAWVFFAAGGIPYGFFVLRDAQRDVAVRKVAGLGDGRETLARLLVTTSSLYVFAFTVFLLTGLYVLSPLSRIEGWWRGLPVPIGLIIGLAALTFMMFHKHRVRRAVLQRDMEDEQVRVLAAAVLLSNDMQANTAAQHDVADALRAMTHELGNGPLAASLASTVAMDRLSTAMDTNTALHISEVGANTAGLEASTAAAEDLKVSTDELKVSTDAATLVVKTQIEIQKANGDTSDG